MMIGLTVDPRHGYLSSNNIMIVINELARRGVVKRGVTRSISATNIVDIIASKYKGFMRWPLASMPH
jgi:hypothetical protein